MKSPLQEVFKKGKALIPYITAGDPSLEATASIVKVLEESGADIIEIGVPFSDPQADGPVIQASSARALERGTTLPKVLERVHALRERVKVPLVLMGYFNPILSYGAKRFAEDAARAGISGVIIPDLPFDEDPPFYQTLADEGIEGIFMVAPNTSEKRLEALGKHAAGFVYCVSLYGITGDNRGPVQNLAEYISTVRKHVHVPLAVGFGIDSPQKAAAAAAAADGVIVGSALVSMVERLGQDEAGRDSAIRAFMEGLRGAIDSA
jgi:tryptophan synthase alpha chain